MFSNRFIANLLLSRQWENFFNQPNFGEVLDKCIMSLFDSQCI